MSTCRIGNRKLDRKTNRHLDRYTTRMLEGRRRPPRPNQLRQAFRLLQTYVRLAEAAVHAKSSLFDRKTHRDDVTETLTTERRRQEEADDALNKI